MTAVPQPPARQCRRFSKDGSRCANRTVTADGWCRSCDGFVRAEAGLPQQNQLVHEQADRPASLWQVANVRPLESDEAYEVEVSRAAVGHFIRFHGGDRRTAEAQIRSLLEDLLVPGAGTVLRHAQTGVWRLRPGRLGYLVTLNPEAAVVTGYQTLHVERTYAQMKAGVASRSQSARPRTRPRKEKGWFLAAQDALPFVVSSHAAWLYARQELGLAMNQANTAEVIDQLVTHLERSGFTLPEQEGESSFKDPTGMVWTVRVFPGHRPYLSRVSTSAAQ